jgi:predicted 3-demethylubiquinone-9 3-methyltransferase (glyoxalase superfamily)
MSRLGLRGPPAGARLKDMGRINPCLWFADQAEEAANFYTSVFPNSRITEVQRSSDDGPGPSGSVMVVSFELDGERFMALNGGGHVTFSEAISLYVDCETQDEVDALWNALTEGGVESQCGWLRDRYGVSWQIVPRSLSEMLADPDPVKAGAVMQAMLKMTKIDTQVLRDAYESAA